MTEKKAGFRILATEEDGRIHIVIPEHPNVDAYCGTPGEIMAEAMAAKEKDEMNKAEKTAVCPSCGKSYKGYPAVSRKDNKTEICPECGTLEALDAAGISGEEKAKILAEIKMAQEKAITP